MAGGAHRTVISASGDLDVANAAEFREALHHVIDAGPGPWSST